MGSRYIDENVKRRLYAESMGYCMNPSCRCCLFTGKGDIVEKAHIDPYCKTADNSSHSPQTRSYPVQPPPSASRSAVLSWALSPPFSSAAPKAAAPAPHPDAFCG